MSLMSNLFLKMDKNNTHFLPDAGNTLKYYFMHWYMQLYDILISESEKYY